MSNSATNATVEQLVRAGPSVSVTGLTLFGVGLSDWVFIVTILYTVLQIAYLINKWGKETNVWQRAKNALASFTRKLPKF